MFVVKITKIYYSLKYIYFMKSIIEVPLYSIGEADGLNTAIRQRTFKDAVVKMCQSGGMYIVHARDKCYGRYKTVVKLRENPITYIFGDEYSINEGRKIFNSFAMDWLDDIEEKGFKTFVYCPRAAGTQLMPVGENDIVISYDFVRKLVGENIRISGAKEWLLSEPVFRVIGQEKPDFFVLSEITTKMKYEDIVGFEAFSCVYYADGTFDIEGEGRQYVFEDALVDKYALRQRFLYNRDTLRKIDAFDGEVMVLDKNEVYGLRENHVPIRRCFINTWNR